MHRSFLAPLVVFVLALGVLFTGGGCGGGGGSSSSGGGTTGRPLGTIFSQQIVGTAPGSQTARSLANLEVGDIVDLRSLALYFHTTLGYQGGFYEDVSSVVLNAPAGVATLTGSTLTAVGVGTGTINLIGANGQSLTVGLTVSTNLANVTGRVRRVQSGNSNPGVGTAIVRFRDSSGDVVASVPAGPDGRFQANVPTSATSFVVDFSTLPNSFYDQFAYGSLDYTASITNCGVPLPALTASSSITLNDAIAYRKTSTTAPPPPPTGCGG